MFTRVALFLALALPALADEFSARCADRTAIERVYYKHRLGEKPPFENVSPPQLIEKLVKQELQKEAVLKKIYAVTITANAVEAEVQRINATTRAPEILVELKAALGNDPKRFARTVARPIVVERTLRERFENDDKLHSRQRRQVEQTREALLAAKRNGDGFDKLLAMLKQGHSNAVTEIVWHAGPRVKDDEGRFYFEDLPVELQNVLRAQLRQRDDVSAVIEMPSGFALYVANETTPAFLSVAGLSLPKRGYEQWLAEQRQ